jgi:predicted nucleotidyltransferase
MEYRKEISEIVSIIRGINPQKIYLFGSYATGKFDEYSDIDLLVVAPSNERPLDRRLRLSKMLFEYDCRIGLDILHYTPEEFELFKKEPSSFLTSILRRGVKLYDSSEPS